ncbi:MAG TPA: hypothetical protein VHV09_02325 [Trebonia sp.]|jgi:hypothetical protein|nr:hypothetical protein [Trebonia sp.]
MSGEWPPDWEDPDEVFPAQAEQLDEATGARLSEVSAYLASVPGPVLPDSVAARIRAAIAAEAAARSADNAQPVDNRPAEGNGLAGDKGARGDGRKPGDNALPVDNGSASPDEKPAGARTLGPAPARARVRRRRRSLQTLLVAGPVLAVCLLFAGIGYALSNMPSSSSSSAASGASAPAVPGPAYSASGTSAAGDRAPASAAEPAFTVTESGTKYQQASLAGQVQAVLAGGGASAGGSQPGASSSGAAASSVAAGQSPTPALLGCVQHLTGGSQPALVDRATYQGTPAYVIASSSRVWVVGLGCTAADPELITSVPLTG